MLTLIIIFTIIGFVSHFFAMFIVGNILVTSSSFEIFIGTIKKMVYTICFIVVLFWFLFDKQAILLTAFASGFFLTLARVDYDDIREFFSE